MSEPILQSLITASAAFIGALIALGSSLIASRRTEKIAREQARYNRGNERRDEVLAAIFGMLYEFGDAFDDLLGLIERRRTLGFPDVDEEAFDELVTAFQRVNEEHLKLLHYHEKHYIWIPESLTERIYRMVQSSEEIQKNLISELKTYIQHSEKPSDDIIRTSRDWLDNDYRPDHAMLRDSIRRFLGVEDE